VAVDMAAGSVVVGVEVLATKVEGASVSTRTADLEDRRAVLVGMALRAAVTGAVVTEVAEADSVHREVAVGMEVGTAPILSGRAQGWTRIAIQSDQGIELIFTGVPPGSHHGVSLPECFCFFTFSLPLSLLSLPPTCCVSIQYHFGLQYERENDPWNETDLRSAELSYYNVSLILRIFCLLAKNGLKDGVRKGPSFSWRSSCHSVL